MSDPMWTSSGEADLIEQSLEVVVEDEPDSPPEVGWESDPADTLDQNREVGYDEDHDPHA